MRWRHIRRELLELVDMRGPIMSVAPLHHPVLHEPRERFFERKGATASRDRDLLMQVLQGIPPDVLARPVTYHEEFRAGTTPPPVLGRSVWVMTAASAIDSSCRIVF